LIAAWQALGRSPHEIADSILGFLSSSEGVDAAAASAARNAAGELDPAADFDDQLAVNEAAAVVNRSPQTIRNWIASGVVPTVAGRRPMRVTRSDLLLVELTRTRQVRTAAVEPRSPTSWKSPATTSERVTLQREIAERYAAARRTVRGAEADPGMRPAPLPPIGSATSLPHLEPVRDSVNGGRPRDPAHPNAWPLPQLRIGEHLGEEISVQQAAELAGVSETTIRCWANQRKIHSIRGRYPLRLVAADVETMPLRRVRRTAHNE
jgi:hypothetical protein